VCLAVAFSARAAEGATLPSQGLYEACDQAGSGDECLAHLDRMRAGGFTLVLNYRIWWASASELQRYADRAQALGMKIIWPFDSPMWRLGGDLRGRYPQLAATCGCSDDESFRRYVVDLVSRMPATWGYYVGDEVPDAEHAHAKALADKIKAWDPIHPRLMIASESPYTGGRPTAAMADTADVLGGDFYPIGTDPIESMATVASNVAAVGQQQGKPVAMVLQAMSWELYPDHNATFRRWPTADEIRTMRDLALEHGRPSLLLWYSYFDVASSPDAERHWADLLTGAFAPLPDPAPPSPPPPAAAAAPTAPRLRVPTRVRGKRARRAALRRSLARCATRRGPKRRRACRARARSYWGHGPAARWHADGSTRSVELSIYRLAGGRRKLVEHVVVARPADSYRLRGLRPGAYVVSARAAADGRFSPHVSARFRALR
jgi:hypothetical protein